MYDLRPLIDPLLELVFELLLKQAARRVPRALRSAQRRITEPRRAPFTVKQAKFVDHEPVLRSIQAALEDAPNSRVLYFSGPGGAGKSRLLQEAARLTTRYGRPVGARWGGVVDLYHSDFHSVPALQTAIAQSLDSEGRYFDNYSLQRSRFERRRAQGLKGLELDAEMSALERVFLSDYEAYAADYRPVLAFDTLENLSYETDFIQTISQLGASTSTARDWLLHQAGNLPNTLLMLAGRPDPAFVDDLRHIYERRPGQLEVIDVSGLTRADSRVLLKSLTARKSRSMGALNDDIDRLWQVTQGLPVQLALAVDLVLQTELFDPADIHEASNPEAWRRLLVLRLFRYSEESARTFYFLAIARQGLTCELLRYLAPEWPEEACQQHLTDAQRLCVVKTRPGTSEVFLHDALYELFDAYGGDDASLPEWHRRIAEYYQAQQEQRAGEPLARQNAMVKRLYHLLQHDPRLAFLQYYRHWSESAIKGHEVTLDMQLRNVLLRCLAHWSGQNSSAPSSLDRSEVELDGAVRWVKRLLARSRNEQAALLAETILWLGPETYAALVEARHPQNPLLSDQRRSEARDLFGGANAAFWGVLLTYYGEALAYLGPVGLLASDILSTAIVLLGNPGNVEVGVDAWLEHRSLGRAYNTQGYVAQLAGHYGVAQQAFRDALRYFHALDIADEEADTLNNLAYLLGVLGERADALDSVNRALDLRLNLGQQYPLALSYNTRGLILGLSDQMEWGIKDCSLALSIFEDAEEGRGIGLACNALGFLLRHQACDHHPEEKVMADEIFSRSASFLERAERIFSTEVVEPVRLWEAKNELASLYRDWAQFALRCRDVEKAHTSFKDAERYQREALDVAREHSLQYQEADTRDDLAKLLADQGRYAEAESELSYIEQHLVADEYKLVRGRSSVPGQQRGETACLVQGKVHLKRGLWSLQRLKSSEATVDAQDALLDHAIENFALCAAYLHLFWPKSGVLAQAIDAAAVELAASHVPAHRVASLFRSASQAYGVELQAISEKITAKLDF